MFILKHFVQSLFTCDVVLRHDFGPSSKLPVYSESNASSKPQSFIMLLCSSIHLRSTYLILSQLAFETLQQQSTLEMER